MIPHCFENQPKFDNLELSAKIPLCWAQSRLQTAAAHADDSTLSGFQSLYPLTSGMSSIAAGAPKWSSMCHPINPWHFTCFTRTLSLQWGAGGKCLASAHLPATAMFRPQYSTKSPTANSWNELVIVKDLTMFPFEQCLNSDCIRSDPDLWATSFLMMISLSTGRPTSPYFFFVT